MEKLRINIEIEEPLRGWETLTVSDEVKEYQLAVVPSVFQSDLCWDVEENGIVGRHAEEYLKEGRFTPESSGVRGEHGRK